MKESMILSRIRIGSVAPPDDDDDEEEDWVESVADLFTDPESTLEYVSIMAADELRVVGVALQTRGLEFVCQLITAVRANVLAAAMRHVYLVRTEPLVPAAIFRDLAGVLSQRDATLRIEEARMIMGEKMILMLKQLPERSQALIRKLCVLFLKLCSTDEDLHFVAYTFSAGVFQLGKAKGQAVEILKIITKYMQRELNLSLESKRKADSDAAEMQSREKKTRSALSNAIASRNIQALAAALTSARELPALRRDPAYMCATKMQQELVQYEKDLKSAMSGRVKAPLQACIDEAVRLGLSGPRERRARAYLAHLDDQAAITAKLESAAQTGDKTAIATAINLAESFQVLEALADAGVLEDGDAEGEGDAGSVGGRIVANGLAVSGSQFNHPSLVRSRARLDELRQRDKITGDLSEAVKLKSLPLLHRALGAAAELGSDADEKDAIQGHAAAAKLLRAMEAAQAATTEALMARDAEKLNQAVATAREVGLAEDGLTRMAVKMASSIEAAIQLRARMTTAAGGVDRSEIEACLAEAGAIRVWEFDEKNGNLSTRDSDAVSEWTEALQCRMRLDEFKKQTRIRRKISLARSRRQLTMLDSALTDATTSQLSFEDIKDAEELLQSLKKHRSALTKAIFARDERSIEKGINSAAKLGQNGPLEQVAARLRANLQEETFLRTRLQDAVKSGKVDMINSAVEGCKAFTALVAIPGKTSEETGKQDPPGLEEKENSDVFKADILTSEKTLAMLKDEQDARRAVAKALASRDPVTLAEALQGADKFFSANPGRAQTDVWKSLIGLARGLQQDLDTYAEKLISAAAARDATAMAACCARADALGLNGDREAAARGLLREYRNESIVVENLEFATEGTDLTWIKEALEGVRTFKRTEFSSTSPPPGISPTAAEFRRSFTDSISKSVRALMEKAEKLISALETERERALRREEAAARESASAAAEAERLRAERDAVAKADAEKRKAEAERAAKERAEKEAEEKKKTAAAEAQRAKEQKAREALARVSGGGALGVIESAVSAAKSAGIPAGDSLLAEAESLLTTAKSLQSRVVQAMQATDASVLRTLSQEIASTPVEFAEKSSFRSYLQRVEATEDAAKRLRAALDSNNAIHLRSALSVASARDQAEEKESAKVDNAFGLQSLIREATAELRGLEEREAAVAELVAVMQGTADPNKIKKAVDDAKRRLSGNSDAAALAGAVSLQEQLERSAKSLSAAVESRNGSAMRAQLAEASAEKDAKKMGEFLAYALGSNAAGPVAGVAAAVDTLCKHLCEEQEILKKVAEAIGSPPGQGLAVPLSEASALIDRAEIFSRKSLVAGALVESKSLPSLSEAAPVSTLRRAVESARLAKSAKTKLIQALTQKRGDREFIAAALAEAAKVRGASGWAETSQTSSLLADLDSLRSQLDSALRSRSLTTVRSACEALSRSAVDGGAKGASLLKLRARMERREGLRTKLLAAMVDANDAVLPSQIASAEKYSDYKISAEGALCEGGPGFPAALLEAAKKLSARLTARAEILNSLRAATDSRDEKALETALSKASEFSELTADASGALRETASEGLKNVRVTRARQTLDAIKATRARQEAKEKAAAERKRAEDAAKAAEAAAEAENEKKTAQAAKAAAAAETSTSLAPTAAKPKAQLKPKPKPKPAAKAKSAAKSTDKSSNRKGLMSLWNKRAKSAEEDMKTNVFSKNYKGTKKLKRGDKGYGTAKEGSKSAARAKKAKLWVKEQIGILLHTIRRVGSEKKLAKSQENEISKKQGLETGAQCMQVSFGVLFKTYQDISDTLVGMLRRAKKYKLLGFKGDMLFQGQSDGVMIFLMPKAATWKYLPEGFKAS